MWLSKQQKRREQEPAAESGRVTIAGERAAVALDSERRGLEVYAPGGYRWRPAAGERVLVLKTGEGLCIAGTPSAGGLEEGEVGLSGPEGTAVTLKQEGVLALDGAVTVNGEGLSDLVRRIATAAFYELMAGQS